MQEHCNLITRILIYYAKFIFYVIFQYFFIKHLLFLVLTISALIKQTLSITDLNLWQILYFIKILHHLPLMFKLQILLISHIFMILLDVDCGNWNIIILQKILYLIHFPRLHNNQLRAIAFFVILRLHNVKVFLAMHST